MNYVLDSPGIYFYLFFFKKIKIAAPGWAYTVGTSRVGINGSHRNCFSKEPFSYGYGQTWASPLTSFPSNLSHMTMVKGGGTWKYNFADGKYGIPLCE
jgi:hypothetical protein